MAASDRIKAIDVAIAMKRFAVPPSDAEIETVIRFAFPKSVRDDVAHIIRLATLMAADPPGGG